YQLLHPAVSRFNALALAHVRFHAFALARNFGYAAFVAVRVVEGEGFEPSKRSRNRFTVCPLWPLGYPSVSHKFNYTINKTCGQFFLCLFFYKLLLLSSLFSKYRSNFLFTRCNALSIDFTSRRKSRAISC